MPESLAGAPAPAPSFDGTPESLAQILQKAGMDRDRIGLVLYHWLAWEVQKGGGATYIDDDGYSGSYRKPIHEALIRILGEEEGDRIANLAATQFSSLASGPAMLTELERETLKRIKEEEAAAIRRLWDELERRGGQMSGGDWTRVRRERDKKIRSLFGDERYLEYLLQTDYVDEVKAGKLAGLSHDEMREWVRLRDESEIRQEELEEIADKRMRAERREQIQEEYRQKEMYLLGAREVDFIQYQDRMYWVLKRFLKEAKSDVDPDLLYGELARYRERIRVQEDYHARRQAAAEARAELKARYPDVPEWMWDRFDIR